MRWPRKLYVATKTLGVFYAEDFSVPTTQPTWAAVNDGLPATDVRQFALDPFDPVGKQYLLLETARTLYRRDDGGDWAAILTSAQALALVPADTAGSLVSFCLDPSVAGRIWVTFNGSHPGPLSVGTVHVLYSDDYGTTWADTTVLSENWVDPKTVHYIAAYGDTVFVSYNGGGGFGCWYSTNKGGAWASAGSPWDSYLALNPLQPDRVYYSKFLLNGTGQKYLTSAGAEVTLAADIPMLAACTWFSPTVAAHQRVVAGYKLYVTTDSWDTKNTPSVITPNPLSIAPWAGADEDNIIVGLTLDTDPAGGLQPHVIGVLYSEDDTTAIGIAGAMCDESPYTDSIPMTCGGAAIGGIAAVEEATTEQPVPPDGEAITIPGNGPVILDGVANSQAVTMPGYTGTARGEPLPGDRGAWAVDTESHAKLHASDILAEAPTRHTPEPGAANQVVVSDGTKWTSAAVPTQDAADVTYTPTTLTDWDSDADPGDVDAALDQLAERVDDLEGGAIADHDHSGDVGDGGTFDAANLTSGLATDGQVLTADGSGGAAWEDAAGGAVDAGDVTYTPTTLADWASDTDPGDLDDALDQIADRVTTLEESAKYSLTVEEADGTPTVSGVTTIKVTNGTLTDNTGGVVTLDFGSAATDGAAIHDNTAGEIHAITEKTSPADADEIIVEDSADSWAKKRVAISNLPSGGGGGAPTDAKYVVAASSGDLSAEIVIPGMAGHPDIPPTSPNTEDDEFDNSTLDGKWTKTSNASSDDVNTTWPSCAYARFTGNQYYWLKQSYAPDGAFTLTAKFFFSPQENYQQCGITVYDDDESDAVRAVYEYTNGMKFDLHTRDSGNWNYNRKQITITQFNCVYICLARDGSNNWQAWVSFNGLSWWQVGTSYNKSLTVHHFVVSADSGGSSFTMRTGIDWVRRDWITP